MNQQEPEERRTSTRFTIPAPAVVTVGNRQIQAFTREISTRAVYFRISGQEEKPPHGELLEFLVKIPPSMSYSRPSFIKGRGRTIRVDDLAGEETGVVVEILDYDIEGEPVNGHAEDHMRSGG